MKLPMQYKVVNGLNVCDNGQVIIAHTQHIVSNGFVKCCQSLNGSAWNTTNETSICPKCFQVPIQLKFDFRKYGQKRVYFKVIRTS